MALKSLVFYAKVKVILQTQTMGCIDVSDDVVSCTVTLRLNAASTASVTLNNYSNQISGRYNFLLSIGDKAHISFILNGVEFAQLTGRVFDVPLVAFDSSDFTIQIQDCIGDLMWQFWCPFSTEAQNKYLTWNEENITEAAEELGQADSGMGSVFLDFMENVCRFPKNSIYIQKFPDLDNVMKNILKTIVCNNDPNAENEYEAVFMQLFDFKPNIFRFFLCSYGKRHSDYGSGGDGTNPIPHKLPAKMAVFRLVEAKRHSSQRRGKIN